MSQRSRSRLFLLISALGAVSLSACDWVDSTGSQTAEQAVTQVFLDDALVEGAIFLSENTLARIAATRDTTATEEQTFTWGNTPLLEGRLDVCAAQDDFNMDLAAESLLEACTVSSACDFTFQQVETEDGAPEFRVLAPVLKASVGMRYALTVEDTAGRSRTEDFDFCLIAVNDKPVANDDTFVVIEGTRLVVDANGANLLSNDSDDLDVSNTEYRILEQASIEPEFAASFELRPDGGFTYESNLTDIRADQLDIFEYELSDGVNETSKAQVTLRIVTSNQAPELIDPVPVLFATEDEAFLENLALYFSDPEGNSLTFSFVDDSNLPPAGSLVLDDNGLFSGIPAEDDVGSYVLTLVASDGGRETETTITLEVDAAPLVPENSPPEYEAESVFDQIILLGRSIRTVQPVFEDPDGDELTYSIIGTSDLPTGVEIDENTGTISGRPLARIWVRNLRVEATDPFGESAISESFFIRVR